MIDALLKKIFGTKHERDVKRMMPVVQAINAVEASLAPLDDAGLRAKSEEFKKRIEDGEPLARSP
jgi:preprotein translocase subunit SecA